MYACTCAAKAASGGTAVTNDKKAGGVPTPMSSSQLQLSSNPLFARLSTDRKLTAADLRPDALPALPPDDSLYQQYMARFFEVMKDVNLLSTLSHQARIAPRAAAFVRRTGRGGGAK